MNEPRKISREDEAKIPPFTSHDEARKWFKNQNGDQFMLVNSEVIDGHKCYFNNLILNKEAYAQGQESLIKREQLKGLDYLFSYQSIEIFETGQIHIVH
jgi:hypothetical protein